MSQVLDLLIRWSNQPFFFPFYHAVADTPGPHYQHLYPPRGIDEFERDLDCFLRHFEPLSLTEFAKVKSSPGKKRYCLITFDDGLSEVYEHAFPLLVKKKIPAVVFLNPDFVDNRFLFYRYKVSLLIEEMKIRSFENRAEWMDEVGENFETAGAYLMSLKIKDTDRINRIARLMGVSFEDYLQREKPYLTMSQIMEMKLAGIQFGGHSMNHPLFSELSMDKQVRQAVGSMDWVSEQIGEEIRAFAFPFSDAGVSKSFFDEISADCSFGTAKIKVDDIPGHYQRLSMEAGSRSAVQILLREYFAFLLKRVLGRHIVKR